MTTFHNITQLNGVVILPIIGHKDPLLLHTHGLELPILVIDLEMGSSLKSFTTRITNDTKAHKTQGHVNVMSIAFSDPSLRVHV